MAGEREAMTRRSLFQTVVVAFAGSILARMPLAGAKEVEPQSSPYINFVQHGDFFDKDMADESKLPFRRWHTRHNRHLDGKQYVLSLIAAEIALRGNRW